MKAPSKRGTCLARARHVPSLFLLRWENHPHPERWVVGHDLRVDDAGDASQPPRSARSSGEVRAELRLRISKRKSLT